MANIWTQQVFPGFLQLVFDLVHVLFLCAIANLSQRHEGTGLGEAFLREIEQSIRDISREFRRSADIQESLNQRSIKSEIAFAALARVLLFPPQPLGRPRRRHSF